MTTKPLGPTAVKPPDERSPEGPVNLSREDVKAINARLAYLSKHYGGLRVHEATFRIPWPLTRSQYEEYRKKAVDKWLDWMEKRGWELKSKVHVRGMKPAYDLYGAGWETVPLLDRRQVVVMAAFQIKKLRSKRFEVLVKSA